MKSNIDRSNHQRCSVKKDFLKNFANFTEKHPCWSLFLIKFQASNFIKMRLQPRCFLEKFAKFVRKPILKNICEQLLLHRGCGCYVDDVEDKDKRIG